MPDQTEITNDPQHPVPVQMQPQAPVHAVQVLPQLTDAYNKAGPNGFFVVLAGVVIVGVMSMFWMSIRNGQDAAKVSQDLLYKQLLEEQKASNIREDRLLDRSDKISKDQQDRWEKSRERSEELRSEVKSMSGKVDALVADTKAINVYLKLMPKEKP